MNEIMDDYKGKKEDQGENQTMNGQIENRQKKTMQAYFMDKVTQAVEGMSGAVSDDEARRLTYNLVTAAQESIDKGGGKFVWTQQSIHSFLTQAIMHITAGLDASNDEVYAFPQGQKMSVQPSYRGYRKMIKDHAVGRKIIDLQCYAIREGEEFEVEYGAADHKWRYKSLPFNTAPVLGYVTVIIYEDGSSQVMEHTLEDIKKRRQAGSSGNSPAWRNWETEMSKAKAIKRHAKSVDIRLRQDVQEYINNMDKEDLSEQEVMDDGGSKIQLSDAKPVEDLRIGEHEMGTITDSEAETVTVARWVGDDTDQEDTQQEEETFHPDEVYTMDDEDWMR